jgi:hypothetical protein
MTLAAEANVFVEAGVPATDREWTGTDYKLALATLATTKLSLPHFREKDGRAVLERMTAQENFSFHRNKTLPIEARMLDHVNLVQAMSAISKLYYEAANKGQDVHKEIAAVLAFTLQAAVPGMELVDEFLPTVPRDEKYAVRLDGLKKVKSGLTGMFVGAEASLGETKFYSAQDLSLLLETMAATLPRLKTALSAEYRNELRQKLKAHKLRFEAKGDLQRIDEMLKELGR